MFLRDLLTYLLTFLPYDYVIRDLSVLFVHIGGLSMASGSTRTVELRRAPLSRLNNVEGSIQKGSKTIYFRV